MWLLRTFAYKNGFDQVRCSNHLDMTSIKLYFTPRIPCTSKWNKTCKFVFLFEDHAKAHLRIETILAKISTLVKFSVWEFVQWKKSFPLSTTEITKGVYLKRWWCWFYSITLRGKSPVTPYDNPSILMSGTFIRLMKYFEKWQCFRNIGTIQKTQLSTQKEIHVCNEWT